MNLLNNKTKSSRDSTISIMSFISSFDIISVVALFYLPDPKIFLCIPASAADAAAVNPQGIKTKFLPRNPRDCTILDN